MAFKFVSFGSVVDLGPGVLDDLRPLGDLALHQLFHLGGRHAARIRALLEESPFRGRVPVFAGDDFTDESGFAVVNASGGHSVLVGAREPSAAHYALRDPAAVRRWLDAAGPGLGNGGNAE